MTLIPYRAVLAARARHELVRKIQPSKLEHFHHRETDMDDKDQICKDLAKLFTALPQTNSPKSEVGRSARKLTLSLIGSKLVKLRDLGLEWR